MSAGPHAWQRVWRIVLKAGLLLLLLNGLFVVADPLPLISRISLYNVLMPGRERLPYGVDPASYNLSPNSIETMFATHTLARPKAPDEYRVLLLGDSAVWGILLRPAETLSGQLNALNLRQPDGRRVRVYNLGYPMMSLTKDVLLLDEARRYQPDLIIWLVTLESFALAGQLEPPPVQGNWARLQRLHEAGILALNLDDPRWQRPTLAERTLFGQRRALADWLRLQVYGVAWATTGIDQVYGAYTPRANDFDAESTWQGLTPEQGLVADAIALDVLRAGRRLAGDVPLLVINEPIFRADGRNSDLRYNFWYPRWAYDAYRGLLADWAQAEQVPLFDLWDAVDAAEFTDSPVHLTPAGSAALAERVAAALDS